MIELWYFISVCVVSFGALLSSVGSIIWFFEGDQPRFALGFFILSLMALSCAALAINNGVFY